MKVIAMITDMERLPANCQECSVKGAACELPYIVLDSGRRGRRFKKTVLEQRHMDCPLREMPFDV